MQLDWPPEKLDSRIDYASYAGVYDLLYGNRDDDIRFYLEYANQCAGPIVELGCGSGRLTAALVKAGYCVIAIDNSPQMLVLCKKRIGNKLKPNVSFHLGDARELSLPQKYDLIIAPFAMVAHLYSNKDRVSCFRRVLRHLKPEGLFVFDDANRTTWATSKNTAELEFKRQLTDPNTGGDIRMLSNYFYDAKRPVIVRYDYIDWLKGERVVRRKIVRVSFRYTTVKQEIEFLKQAGFGRVQVRGDWDNRPFNFKAPQDNSRVIFIASRK